MVSDIESSLINPNHIFVIHMINLSSQKNVVERTRRVRLLFVGAYEGEEDE